MEELRYSKKRIRICIGTLLEVILAIGLIIVCNHGVSEKKSDSKYNESIETNGSILNNIVFGGELAEESGKIYYSNANDNWNLYCKNLKGETEQKLHDNRCDNINIGKGWVFCRDVKNHQIIKMRLDGSKKQVIYKGIIDNLVYYGDYLYFLEEREGMQHIAQIRCDGSEKTYIYSNREDRICNLILVQDWIYYYSINHKMIEKVNIDGSSNTNVVKAEMDFFIADKKGIYFADKEKQKICYVDYNGRHLSVISNSCPRYMYIFEGQLYYCNGNDSIWKEELREDKSEKYVDKKVLRFYKTDNVLLYYYIEKSGREKKICQQILSRESIQPVKVTDETGKKCVLKLAKLNEKDTGVYFREADPTSVFGQIDNGHYYYLKSNGKRKYKICRDEDVFVGEFTLDYGYISGFAKYQNDFYAFITIEEGEAEVDTTRQALVRVDLKNKKVQSIIDDYEKTENADSQDNYFWADHLYDYSALYQQYIYHDSRDEVIDKKLDYQPYKSGKALQRFSINNKEKREKILSTSNMNEAKPYLAFVDGQILYGRQKGKKVYLYAYDLNTKKESEILCYKRKKAYKCYGVPPFHPTNYDCVFVTMDETYIYCQEFAIPRKGGKMQPLLRNAGEYWGGQFAFSTNRKYIFYLDKKYQLHRVDKKTRKDVKLSKKKWMSVYATDEKIYLVEYDENIVGAYWQEDEGDVVQDHDFPGENALYCMDFQGEMKKVG